MVLQQWHAKFFFLSVVYLETPSITIHFFAKALVYGVFNFKTRVWT